MIMIKHYFTPHQAGVFSAAAVLAKLIFYILFTAMISKYKFLSEEQGMYDDSNATIKKELFWGLIYAVGGATVLSLLANPLIGLMFGYKYVSGVAYVWLVNVYTIILFLLGIIIVFNVKLRRTKTFIWTSLVACVVNIYLVIRFHESITQILYILIGTDVVLLLANVAVTILKKPSRAVRIEN
jgi:O-antigen/teichoic acid export membrane protein